MFAGCERELQLGGYRFLADNGNYQINVDSGQVRQRGMGSS